MNEHDSEPVRGLPARLPEGEHILWQGSPDWRTLARTGLHAPVVGGYFGLLAVWGVVDVASQGGTLGAMASRASLMLAGGAVAVALLVLYAWLNARTTVYTLTNKRFVLRHGVALSKIFNIPYRIIATAGLKADAKGFGDIPLQLTAENKVAYPHLWPHVRPWRFSHPEPMLRAVADAPEVARVLREAARQAALAADRPFASAPLGPDVSAAPAPVAQPAAA